MEKKEKLFSAWGAAGGNRQREEAMTVPTFRKYRLALAAMLAMTAFTAMAEDLEMWERSGGNAGMVDALVAAWNAKNPDRKIHLTYIPHTEMVPKIAQAIASGEVPDLMGMDLIYGPQFESAGQLVDITDLICSDPSCACGIARLSPLPSKRRRLRASITWIGPAARVPSTRPLTLPS